MNFPLHGAISGGVVALPLYAFDLSGFIVGFTFGTAFLFGILADVIRYFDEKDVAGQRRWSLLGHEAHNFEGLFNHWFWIWNLPFALHNWIDWLWHDEDGNWKKGMWAIELAGYLICAGVIYLICLG